MSVLCANTTVMLRFRNCIHDSFRKFFIHFYNNSPFKFCCSFSQSSSCEFALEFIQVFFRVLSEFVLCFLQLSQFSMQRFFFWLFAPWNVLDLSGFLARLLRVVPGIAIRVIIHYTLVLCTAQHFYRSARGLCWSCSVGFFKRFSRCFQRFSLDSTQRRFQN